MNGIVMFLFYIGTDPQGFALGMESYDIMDGQMYGKAPYDNYRAWHARLNIETLIGPMNPWYNLREQWWKV